MKHLDENMIQAFLDGELSDKLTTFAAQHLSLCERCTNAFLRAEAEMAEINLAFSAEKTAPVPTQRIWARIENEIDCLAVKKTPAKNHAASFRQQLAAFFTASQIAFAGSLAGIVLISLFALTVLRQQSQNPAQPLDSEVAYQAPLQNQSIDVQTPARETKEEIQFSSPKVSPKRSLKAANFDYKSLKIKQQIKNKEYEINPKSKIQDPKSEDAAPLLEEKNYLTSIAQLSKAVSSSDAAVMRPSFRVDYERNLAIMNKVIEQSQKQARRHPTDENARRALFASYQNKIDLLNTVSEKSQLMASLR